MFIGPFRLELSSKTRSCAIAGQTLYTVFMNNVVLNSPG